MEGEITLRDYVRMLFRQKTVVFLTVAVVLGTVVVGLKLKTPVYAAQVKLLVSAQKQVEAPYYRELGSSRNSEMALTQSEIVESNPVLERAVRALRLDLRPLDYEKRFASAWKAPLIQGQVQKLQRELASRTPAEQAAMLFQAAIESLRKRVRAEPVRGTNLFIIEVKDFDPVAAAAIANTVSRAYVMFDLEQQLAERQLKYGDKHLAIQQLKDTIQRMSQSLIGGPVPNIEAIGPASVKIVEQAGIPLQREGPSEGVIAAFAVVMSLGLGMLLAFLFESLDQTVKSPWEVQRHLKVPYFGSIPKRRFWQASLVGEAGQPGAYAEAYRVLADQLYLALKDRRAQSLLVTSPAPLEGATTVLANVGRCLASRTQQEVLLVDANFRHPSLPDCFDRGHAPGLAEVLAEGLPWESALIQLEPHLFILPAGHTPMNPLPLLESARMRELLAQAKRRFGIVLLDGADTRRYADSAVLARQVDGVVLVVADGKTRRQVLRAAVEPLAQVPEKLFGVVLNARRFVIPKVIYEAV